MSTPTETQNLPTSSSSRHLPSMRLMSTAEGFAAVLDRHPGALAQSTPFLSVGIFHPNNDRSGSHGNHWASKFLGLGGLWHVALGWGDRQPQPWFLRTLGWAGLRTGHTPRSKGAQSGTISRSRGDTGSA